MSAVMEQGWRGLVAGPTRKRAGPLGVLDIGTSKICCYIVRLPAGQGVHLLGRGYQLAEGLRAGEIVDAEAAETSLLAVIHEAEQQAQPRCASWWWPSAAASRAPAGTGCRRP